MYVGEQKVATTGKMRSWNSLPLRKIGAKGHFNMEFVYPEKYDVVASNRQEPIQQSGSLRAEEKQSACCCYVRTLYCPGYSNPILCAYGLTISRQAH